MPPPVIDDTLVHRLLGSQLPRWAGLPLRPIEDQGWDNKSFRLGEQMIVRLPRAAEYAAQVEKERRWLPRLAPRLPLQIPEPLAIGEPTDGYPWKWSVYRWIEGHATPPDRVPDLPGFARDLARFLVALQRIDPAGGPQPGTHNFYRGGPLETYDAQTRQAIAILASAIDSVAASAVWDSGLKSNWSGAPVWLHGDMSAGNLLLREGRLSAVIDFGMLGIGDPACDLAIAWSLFSGESRETFRRTLPLDSGTWARGRSWALWKASIIAAGLSETNALEATQCWRVIGEVLADCSNDG